MCASPLLSFRFGLFYVLSFQRPFCGYNMADYFAHWLTFSRRTEADKLPRIFHVNWFRKSHGGKFLWPGFGDNIRVLEWILERSKKPMNDASNDAVESPIGFLPKEGSIDTSGLNLSAEAMEELNKLEPREWLLDVGKNKEFLHNFGDRLPHEISNQLQQLQHRLEAVDPLSKPHST
jgi:phosphoenolpyruvate carboxykinase (GTP)